MLPLYCGKCEYCKGTTTTPQKYCNNCLKEYTYTELEFLLTFSEKKRGWQKYLLKNNKMLR
jgi:predicted amidophosphoribosyltransferase